LSAAVTASFTITSAAYCPFWIPVIDQSRAALMVICATFATLRSAYKIASSDESRVIEALTDTPER